jgi:hypothetical protein
VAQLGDGEGERVVRPHRAAESMAQQKGYFKRKILFSAFNIQKVRKITGNPTNNCYFLSS